MTDVFATHILGFDVNNHRPRAEGGLFGTTLAFYSVVETQGRGALHAHMLIWIAGSPPTTRALAALVPPASPDPLAAAPPNPAQVCFQTWADSAVHQNCTLSSHEILCPGPDCAGTGVNFNDISEEVKNTQKRYSKPYEGSAQEPATVRCQLCENKFSAKVVFEHSLKTHIAGLTVAQREELMNEPHIAVDARHDLFTKSIERLRDRMPTTVPTSLFDKIKVTLIELSVNVHSWKHRPTCFKKGCGGCRFDLPRQATPAAHTQLSLDEKGRANLQHPAAVGNAWVNSHNRILTMLFLCNNDVKVISSGANGVAFYTCNYAGQEPE